VNRIKFDFSKTSDKQNEFFRARERYVAYGGARGGGKSWAVRHKAVLLACQFPGIKIIIFRRTYEELRKNHIEPLMAMTAGIAKYNTSSKQLTFINGSVIVCGYVDNDGALTKYQGQEYDVMFIDEATNIPEDWIRQLNAIVRGVNGLPKRTYYTCNPGGVSHNYFKRLFVDKQYVGTEDPSEYRFIKALPTDNKALMETQPEYIDYLKSLPEKRRAAWLEGRWDVFEGQFFEEFRDDPEHYKDRRWTHVIEPFDIPRGWQIYRSFDFGYAKPFSCAWWAIDYDGVLYRILELYGCTKTPNEGVKWTPDEIFDNIHKIETQHKWLKGKTIYGVADPSIWDSSRGESVNEAAERHAVYFEKGDNKRIAGWMQCHYRLDFDYNGFPMMYVFNNCKGFIRTIPLLQYSDTHPEDLDTTQEDHIADEWRYMCMSRPLTPPRPEELPEAAYSIGAHALELTPTRR